MVWIRQPVRKVWKENVEACTFCPGHEKGSVQSRQSADWLEVFRRRMTYLHFSPHTSCTWDCKYWWSSVLYNVCRQCGHQLAVGCRIPRLYILRFIRKEVARGYNMLQLSLKLEVGTFLVKDNHCMGRAHLDLKVSYNCSRLKCHGRKAKSKYGRVFSSRSALIQQMTEKESCSMPRVRSCTVSCYCLCEE